MFLWKLLKQVKAEIEAVGRRYQAPLIEALDGDENWERIFQTVSQPRGGMVQIRRRGAAVAADIEKWLDEAYEKFVLRAALQPAATGELGLTNRIQGLLEKWNLDRRFQERRKVGNDRYHVQFPFVEMGSDLVSLAAERETVVPHRAIKPLHLAHDSPTQIQDHGDAWLMKIRRLKEQQLCPKHLIFPVECPAESDVDGQRFDVASQLVSDLELEGVNAVSAADENKFRESLIAN